MARCSRISAASPGRARRRRPSRSAGARAGCAGRDAARRARGRRRARHRLDQRARQRPDRLRPAVAGRAARRAGGDADRPRQQGGARLRAQRFGAEATLFAAHRAPAPCRLRLRGPAVRPQARDRPPRRPLGGRGRGRGAGGDGGARESLRWPWSFGSAVRRQLRAAASTAWSSDPDILGGYSCALAGEAHLRPRLAEPLGERLFFAGEACSLARLRHRARRRRDRHRRRRGGGAAPRRRLIRAAGDVAADSGALSRLAPARAGRCVPPGSRCGIGGPAAWILATWRSSTESGCALRTGCPGLASPLSSDTGK